MISLLRPAALLLALLTFSTGLAYPLAVTGVAQVLFPEQANGSVLVSGGRVVGSTLIGQPFDDPRYFWGRASATSPFPYNASASTGANLGPTNPALATAVRERVASHRTAHAKSDFTPIPIDLVTSSASGLDPHISPAAALFQVARVANVRGLPEERVRTLVAAHLEGRTFDLLGEPRVNVLSLNLALDGLALSGP